MQGLDSDTVLIPHRNTDVNTFITSTNICFNVESLKCDIGLELHDIRLFLSCLLGKKYYY
jgi:hypothetical protein